MWEAVFRGDRWRCGHLAWAGVFLWAGYGGCAAFWARPGIKLIWWRAWLGALFVCCALLGVLCVLDWKFTLPEILGNMLVNI